MVNAPKGASYECGLRIDRQLNADLYLQMEGLPPTPKLFDELVRWLRVCLSHGSLMVARLTKPASPRRHSIGDG